MKYYLAATALAATFAVGLAGCTAQPSASRGEADVPLPTERPIDEKLVVLGDTNDSVADSVQEQVPDYPGGAVVIVGDLTSPERQEEVTSAYDEGDPVVVVSEDPEVDAREELVRLTGDIELPQSEGPVSFASAHKTRLGANTFYSSVGDQSTGNAVDFLKFQEKEWCSEDCDQEVSGPRLSSEQLGDIVPASYNESSQATSPPGGARGAIQQAEWCLYNCGTERNLGPSDLPSHQEQWKFDGQLFQVKYSLYRIFACGNKKNWTLANLNIDVNNWNKDANPLKVSATLFADGEGTVNEVSPGSVGKETSITTGMSVGADASGGVSVTYSSSTTVTVPSTTIRNVTNLEWGVPRWEFTAHEIAKDELWSMNNMAWYWMDDLSSINNGALNKLTLQSDVYKTRAGIKNNLWKQLSGPKVEQPKQNC